MRNTRTDNRALDFLRLAFSENEQPSSKRILAGLIIVVVLFCTSWSVIKFGMTENNKYIIEFEIVTSGALLGVSNITSIWKNNGDYQESNNRRKRRN